MCIRDRVTYPPFVFNYPDNWSVTKEECDQQEELVTLENDGGASVDVYKRQEKISASRRIHSYAEHRIENRRSTRTP